MAAALAGHKKHALFWMRFCLALIAFGAFWEVWFAYYRAWHTGNVDQLYMRLNNIHYPVEMVFGIVFIALAFGLAKSMQAYRDRLPGLTKQLPNVIGLYGVAATYLMLFSFGRAHEMWIDQSPERSEVFEFALWFGNYTNKPFAILGYTVRLALIVLVPWLLFSKRVAWPIPVLFAVGMFGELFFRVQWWLLVNYQITLTNISWPFWGYVSPSASLMKSIGYLLILLNLGKLIRPTEGACPACGYSTLGLKGTICPECGSDGAAKPDEGSGD